MGGATDAGTAADLLGDRAWAGELFIGADAILSALKQVHVEAGPAFRLLARSAEASPGGRIALLTPERRRAVAEVSYAVIEESVDATVFFAFVWTTLHAGGPLVAAGARILVSANTWTPEKRKKLSPWRTVDGWIAEFGPASAEARRWLERQIKREWGILQELWPRTPQPTTAVSWLALPQPRGGTGLPILRPSRDLSLDLGLVRGGFQAAVGSPTRAWLDRVLQRKPGVALGLADIYGRYARSVGF